jgi:starch synthase
LVADERVDVVHVNDWHAALVPLLLSARGGPRPATVLTIHNLAFQGLFPGDLHAELRLPVDTISASGLEFYGRISFLKAGIRFADRITTVSPNYASEILTPRFGCGLEGLLNERAHDVSGILNGVDYGIWDPAADSFIASSFQPGDLAGKRACKFALQTDLGLDTTAGRPLMAYICRLTHQKMTDVVLDALPQILARPVDLAVLGEGDPELESRFRAAAQQYPGRLAVHIGYREPLAHRFYAGSDILLHPSRFEPCGLAPLYALRYGSLPVVRHVGGLADTVIDSREGSLRNGTANGFAFHDDNADDMLTGIDHALTAFRQPVIWRRMQRTAMSQHFGWADSARRYLALYRALAPEAEATDVTVNDIAQTGAAD